MAKKAEAILNPFITFEGGEGCGKSTQAKALWQKLQQQGTPAILTHEPGGTILGDKIRYLLKKKGGVPISAQAELLLFASARAQLVNEIILPSLKRGEVVICDRFADSTTAYQGYGRGIDSTTIETINSSVTQNLKPSLTILLDIPAEKGLARKQSDAKDRFEAEELVFHQWVREGYLKMVAAEPERWLVIDASLPQAKIAKIIWQRVNSLLSLQRGINLRHD